MSDVIDGRNYCRTIHICEGINAACALYDKCMIPSCHHSVGRWPLHSAYDNIASADVFCKDFKCAKGYTLIDDADKTVCKDGVCTKDLCCEPEGKTFLKPWLWRLQLVEKRPCSSLVRYICNVVVYVGQSQCYLTIRYRLYVYFVFLAPFPNRIWLMICGFC